MTQRSTTTGANAAANRFSATVQEARIEATEHGLVPDGEGWFVVNAREARWRDGEGLAAICEFEGESGFPQLGINLNVLAPGEPMAMYHWEPAQEDFLVLAGEAHLIIEGQEHALRQWDFVHCPAGSKHAIIGAGTGLSVVLAVGARDRSTGSNRGGYPVDGIALRHGVGVEEEITDPKAAYGRFPPRRRARYSPGWLPG